MLKETKNALRSWPLALGMLLTACGSGSSDESDSSDSTSYSLSASEICTPAGIKTRFNAFTTAQMQWYKSHGTGALPIQTRRSVYSQGTNRKAIVIIHGFNSSPDALTDLTKVLVGRGFTVITPVLTGYGADAAAANAGGVAEWENTAKDAVNLAKPCHDEVILLGHSMGGALVTDSVLNRKIAGISKLVILAPFYRTYSATYKLAITSLPDDVETYTIRDLHAILGGMDPYKLFPIRPPHGDEPEPFVPVRALKAALSLQKSFPATPTKEKSSVPLLLINSAADRIISSKFAVSFAQSRFSKVESLLYPVSLDIGHSFQTKESNPEFEQMADRIADFAEGAPPVTVSLVER